MKQSKTSRQRVRGAVETEKAVMMRIAGYTYQQIADHLKVTKTAAHRLVTNALESSAKATAESIEHYREIENERLDQLIQRKLRQCLEVGDNQDILTFLRLSERKEKVNGWQEPDGPIKIDAKIEFSSLTDDQLKAELAKVLHADTVSDTTDTDD